MRSENCGREGGGRGGGGSREEQTRVTRQTMRSKKRGGGRHPGISSFSFSVRPFLGKRDLVFSLSSFCPRGGGAEGQTSR